MALGFLDLGVIERMELVTKKKMPNTFNDQNMIFHSKIRKIASLTKRTPLEEAKVLKLNDSNNRFCT
ncbi:hypothetical protein BT93_L5240 [Corymbia citriodora subsp. variegata]|uniref:Uncharacterized protein n=1 Tax=Corymbia citriodora subsp. variegata TaxID=360336 RepID=A0A8T0CX16_CORYI|nr:hypothetical protein BT93_L5240 [Corymbia citriodora subsp. variegata]